MKLAMTLKEKLVEASSANRNQNYRCPVCFAQVSLRSAGQYREAHFAHWPGYGNNDCALFSSGSGQGRAALTQSDSDSYINHELALGLRLMESAGAYAWTLELSIPIMGIENADITIDVGGRYQTLKLRENAENFKVFTAEPQINSYRIISENIQEKIAFEPFRSCVGLSETAMSIFGEIEGPSLHISYRAKEMKCGRGYVLLWNSAQNYEIPEAFEYESLQIQGDWAGAFINIPQTISEEAKHWLETATELPIKETPNGFVPVWPPLIRRHSIDCFEAVKNTSVAIFARQTKSSSGKTLPNVFARSLDKEIGAQAITANDAYFHLVPKNASHVEIGSPQLGGIKADLNFTLELDSFNACRTTFIEMVGITKENVTTKIFLHDGAIIPWLQEVRNNRITFLSIDSSHDISGTMTVGKSGGVSQSYGIKTNIISEEKVLQLKFILDALKDITKDVKFSFRGFGCASIYASFQNQAVSSKNSRRILRRDLKLSMLAFLKQLPNQVSWPPPKVNIEDHELIHLVLNAKPTQKTLATHRFLVNKIKQIP